MLTWTSLGSSPDPHDLLVYGDGYACKGQIEQPHISEGALRARKLCGIRRPPLPLFRAES